MSAGRRFRVLLLCAALMPAPGCATTDARVTKIVAGKRIVTRAISQRAYEHAARAMMYAEEQRWEEAAAEYQRAISEDGDAPELHARLADVFLALDRTQDAEAEVKRSLGIERTAVGLVAEAHLRQRLADVKGAVASLEEARRYVSFTEEPEEAEAIGLELADAQLRALDPGAAAKTLDGLCKALPNALSAPLRDAAVAWATGDLTRALRRYQQGLAIEPNAIDARLELAQLHAAMGRDPQAQREFQIAVERAEGALEVATVYARWLVSKGRLDEARQLADDVAGPSVDEAGAAARMELERVVKRVDRALALIVQLRKDEPSDEARHRLAVAEGVLLAEEGHVTEAVAAFLSVPETAAAPWRDARLRAAAVLREAGRLGEARKVLLPLQKELDDEQDAKARLALALEQAAIEERAGDLALASRRLEALASELPKDDALAMARAALEERRGDWRHALSLTEKVLERDPGSVEALNFWGYVAADHGHEMDRALSRLVAALAQEPASGAIIDSVGWTYFRKGDVTRAALFLEQAGRLVPDDPEVLSHVAALAEKQGDRPRAVTALRKALTGKALEPLRQKLQESLRRLEATEAARP